MENLFKNGTLDQNLKNLTNNASEPPDTQSDSPLSAVIALTIGNVGAILLGTLGNSLVIISVIINRNMRSTTNFFIASLAAADLIVTSICMPLFFVYNVLTWPVWPFGKSGCRIVSFLVHMSVMASALSLLSISYDRFLSVYFPMRKFITMLRAKKLVALIWFVSPFLLLPSLFHHDTKPTMKDGKEGVSCVESWSTPQELHSYQMYRVSCYFLFLLQISVVYFLIGHRLYTRRHPGEQTSQNKAKELLNKRKIIKMLFLVVALFALCWLPYIINKLLNIFPPRPGYSPSNLFVFVGNFLGLLNSVANPLVYAVLNKNFRTAFKNALRCNCNYEVEERRRTASVMTRQTKRTRSESLTVDRLRTSSLTPIENPISNVASRAVGANDRTRVLSFSNIAQDASVEMRDFSDCHPQTPGNSENHGWVCFGNDLFNSTEIDDQKPADHDLPKVNQTLNQEVIHNGLSHWTRRDGSENTHNNVGFQEENGRI